MTLPGHAFFRGRIVPYSEARVGVLTHGLNYGTGVFAGLRGYWNADEAELFVFRPHEHFERFLESARLLDMTLGETTGHLTDALVELLRAELYREDCYVRPLAFYGDESIGVRLHNLTPAGLDRRDALRPIRRERREPARHDLVLAPRRRHDDPAARQDRRLLRQLRLREDRRPASRLRRGDRPERRRPRLGGLGGQRLRRPEGDGPDSAGHGQRPRRNHPPHRPRAASRGLGVPVVERSIDRSEITLADEIFFCGTGVQIAAVTRVDHRPIGTGRMGPVVSALRTLFFDVVRGKQPSSGGWCHPVYADAPAPAAGRRHDGPAPADPGFPCPPGATRKTRGGRRI